MPDSPLRIKHEKMPTTMAATAKRKRPVDWSEIDTNALIDLWGQNIDDLRRVKRNRHVSEKIRTELEEYHGIQRSVEEVKTKIDNLSKMYRKERQKMASGSSPSRWKFFSAVNELLGPFHTENNSHNSHVLESADTNENDPCMLVDNSKNGATAYHVKIVHSPVPSTSFANDAVSLSLSSGASSYGGHSPTATPVWAKRKLARPARANAKPSASADILDLLKTISERQQTNDEKILQCTTATVELLERQTNLQEESLAISRQMVNLMERFLDQ